MLVKKSHIFPHRKQSLLREEKLYQCLMHFMNISWTSTVYSVTSCIGHIKMTKMWSLAHYTDQATSRTCAWLELVSRFPASSQQVFLPVDATNMVWMWRSTGQYWMRRHLSYESNEELTGKQPISSLEREQ